MITVGDIRSIRGFSLLELAIALFILTLLLGSILVPLNTRVQQRQINDAQKIIGEAHEALMGHAIMNGHLPCPDKTTAAGAGTANDGIEDVTGGTCVVTTGNLPWSTLGVASRDPWGNRLRYAVMADFARRSPTVLDFNTAATIRICPYAACAETDLLVPQYVVSDPTTHNNPNLRAAAVILSHGPNGLGAIGAQTGTQNPLPTSADELANTGSTEFVSRIMTGSGAAAGEFDDITHWIGRPLLFSAMIKAGKMP